VKRPSLRPGPGSCPVVILFISALLYGCDGCGGGGGQDGGGLTVELGTGSIDFEPVTDEQDLELHAGPQGGHHFIVHARAQGLVPGDPSQPGQTGNPSTLFEVFDGDGAKIDADFPPYRLGYKDDGNGWFELPSGRILQVLEEVVPQLYGSRVRITVQVEDTLGASGRDERWVHVIEGPLADGDAGVNDGDAGSDGDAGPADAAN